MGSLKEKAVPYRDLKLLPQEGWTMLRYIGKVKALGRTGAFGWIDYDSAEGIGDSRHRGLKIYLNGDVYLHQDDCSTPLREGMWVEFSVKDDPRRKGKMRAFEACVYRALKPGIELHVNARQVDDPGVPMRWCFTPETHARITEGLRQGYGYAVVLVGKHREDDYDTREVRQVHGFNQPFSIFTFSRAGDWDVCAILYERRDVSETTKSASRSLEKDLRRTLLEKDRLRQTYDFHLPDPQQIVVTGTIERLAPWNYGYGEPISASMVTVSVPTGIFAPEPPESVKAFASYFFRDRVFDQCDLRRRLLIMTIGLGFVPWLVWEGLKRTWYLSVGFVFWLFWFESTPQVMAHAFRPAVRLPLPDAGIGDGNSRNGRMKPFNRRPLEWITPGAILCYLVVLILLAKVGLPFAEFLLRILGEQWVGVAIILGVILAICSVVGGVVYAIRRYNDTAYQRSQREHRKRVQRITHAQQMAIKRGALEAQKVEHQAPALVCGDTPAKVSLSAIPKELRSTHMLFTSLKQQVCRPFAR